MAVRRVRRRTRVAVGPVSFAKDKPQAAPVNVSEGNEEPHDISGMMTLQNTGLLCSQYRSYFSNISAFSFVLYDMLGA